jgi:hypothetical protein
MDSTLPASTKFTPLQQELLRLYSLHLPEADLISIKDLIGNYLLFRLQEKVDASVTENNLTDKDFEKWLNEES